MKKEKYIVEIEMPDNDGASPLWLKDVLQSDADLEDEGRWKVSVDKQWKPSEEQMETLGCVIDRLEKSQYSERAFLKDLLNDLKTL